MSVAENSHIALFGLIAASTLLSLPSFGVSVIATDNAFAQNGDPAVQDSSSEIRTAGPSRRVGYVRFDLDGVGGAIGGIAAANITSASLDVYLTKQGDGDSVRIFVLDDNAQFTDTNHTGLAETEWTGGTNGTAAGGANLSSTNLPHGPYYDVTSTEFTSLATQIGSRRYPGEDDAVNEDGLLEQQVVQIAVTDVAALQAAISGDSNGEITLLIGSENIVDGSGTEFRSLFNTNNPAPTLTVLSGPDTTAPSTPTGLAVLSDTDAMVELRWDPGTEADVQSLNLYRSTTSGSFLDPPLATLDYWHYYYTDTTVVNGTTYYYALSASDEVPNESALSPQVVANVAADTTAPAAPANVSALPGDEKVILSWDGNVEPDLAGYIVYRSEISGGPYTAVVTNDAVSPSHIDEGLVNGTTYYYVITAFDDSLAVNESADSAEVSATPELGELEGTVFGSNNDGYGGFTTSTPSGANDTWTLEGDSVKYRSQNGGTLNGSFLGEFILDRSPGKSYRVEGSVRMTDGYADDNNRVGIYLFGDSPEVPSQLEAGAIGLIFNTDDGSAGGPPGTDTDDDIALRVGIDSTALTPDQLRDQGTVPYAQDLFGTEITLAAEITFVPGGGTNAFIQVEGFLTAAGLTTTIGLTNPVAAADYTGDYFGFVTRARARNYVEGGPNSPEERSLPWVMDYLSFSVTEIIGETSAFTSFEQATTPGQFDFAWSSVGGKGYDLVSDTDLANDPSTWPIWQGNADIAASGTGTNTLPNVPSGGDAARYFALVQKDPPPLLDENFDTDAALPTGWVSTGPSNGTDWEVGVPSGGPNSGDFSAPTNSVSEPNCAGTNIADDYTSNADISLISPSFFVPEGSGALLTFNQFADIILPDAGSVQVLDADNADTPIEGLEITGIEGLGGPGSGGPGWTFETLFLPSADVAGKNIKIQFRFESDCCGFNVGGFYVDNVVVILN